MMTPESGAAPLPEVVRLDLPQLEYELLAVTLAGSMLTMAALMSGNPSLIGFACNNLLDIRKDIERRPELRAAQISLLRKITALAPGSKEELADIMSDIDEMERHS